MIEAVVLERLWESLNVKEHIGVALLEIVSIDPAFALVEAASKIQLCHRLHLFDFLRLEIESAQSQLTIMFQLPLSGEEIPIEALSPINLTGVHSMSCDVDTAEIAPPAHFIRGGNQAQKCASPVVRCIGEYSEGAVRGVVRIDYGGTDGHDASGSALDKF